MKYKLIDKKTGEAYHFDYAGIWTFLQHYLPIDLPIVAAVNRAHNEGSLDIGFYTLCG